MNKVMAGVLAAAALWAGWPAQGRAEVLGFREFGLSGRPWTEVSKPGADGRNGRWGFKVDLTRNPWSTAIEVAALNVAVWSVSRYLLCDPWSNISAASMRQNLRTGIVWDRDSLLMNGLGHPAHGSAYFNVARASGLSFWESAPFALAGSAMWEALMETDPASRNDLIFTTFGGIYLGELLHRLSERILDGRARGLERAGRELAAFVLNPAGGLHRLFRGEIFRSEPDPGGSRSPFETRAVLGRTMSGGDPVVCLTFRAGDPFAEDAALGAFDVFVHRSRFRFGKSFGFSQTGYGCLAGTRIGRNGDSGLVLGLFLNYDLRRAEAVRMAASSLAGGLISRFDLGGGARLETSFQLGWTLIGMFDNPYVRIDPRRERDYNFDGGLLVKAEAALNFGRWGTLEMNLSRHDLVVLDGFPGVDRAAFLEASYTVPVAGAWSVGAEVVDARRHSDYRDAPDIRTGAAEYRLTVGLKF